MTERAIFTFTTAASLAGVTPKALRGWLDRDQVHYPSLATRAENQWRRFTLVDVLHLAIVAEIIKYDFRIDFADSVARKITDKVTCGQTGIPDPASFEWLNGLSIKLRHWDYAGDHDPASDEIISRDEQESYGAYLDIKPYRIFREVYLRFTIPDPADLATASVLDIEEEIAKKEAEGRKSRASKPTALRKPKAGRNA